MDANRAASGAMSAEGMTHSFVARIWLERGANGEAIWRGHVRHVQDGREEYFASLHEMGAFLEAIAGVPWTSGSPSLDWSSPRETN